MSFNLDNILRLTILLRFTDCFLGDMELSFPINSEYIIDSKKLIQYPRYHKEWMQYLQFLND